MVKIISKNQFYELSLNAFEKRKDCPYCHNCSSDVIGQIYLPNFFAYPVEKVKLNNQLSNNIHLLKCQNCGLLYKDLIISRETLIQIYKGSKERYKYKSDNRYILQKLQIMKKISRREKQHILDIGCHTGLFLMRAQEMGFETSGIDFSDVAYDECKNFVNRYYYKGFLEDVHFPTNTFDIVTAWDVFEHFYDLGTTLQKIYYSLKSKGYLFLETGNVTSFPAKLKSPNNWWYVSALAHFNFFNSFSARYILNNMNFRIITIDRVFHKSIDEIGPIQISKSLLKSLLFYISPKAYRYLSKIKGTSGEAAKLPWKDHIFIIAQKQ